MTDVVSETPAAFPTYKVSDRFKIIFVGSGLTFLIAALILFCVTGYLAYRASSLTPLAMYAGGSVDKPQPLTDTDKFRVMFGILQVFLPTLICFVAAFLCSLIGIRVLRASGVATVQVISPQDYQLLGTAVASGNDKAIDLWVRLSSLSGATGTFTKIGLTGLPLATIALTLFLGFCGLFNKEFFELAKLTLGAFLGSYVQRQNNVEAGRTVARQAAEETVRSIAPQQTTTKPATQ